MDVPGDAGDSSNSPIGNSVQIASNAAVAAALAYVTSRRLLVKFLLSDIPKASPQQMRSIRAIAMEKTSKILCMIHCAITSYGGYKIVQECAHDILNASSPRISTYGGISTAYMLCDLVSMFFNYREGVVVAGGGNLQQALQEGLTRQPGGRQALWIHLVGFWRNQWLYIVHHIALMTIFIPVALFLSRGHYVAGQMMLCEVSNLMRLVRWFVMNTSALNSRIPIVASGIALTV